MHKPLVTRSPLEAVDSDTESKMSNKRKSSEVPNEDAEPKRPRTRRPSQSEPRDTGSDSTEKREALRRLFSRDCSKGQDLDNEAEDEYEEENEDEAEEPAYIEDPLLLDSIPEYMDPEQLGFLMCAQETLRYLSENGMPFHHPVYVNLRNLFVISLGDIGVA